ncbi:MAG TPA: bifunctional diaminohydroxyphosphoribosylaminopyrimidine deaminase/5-amino-6-(5-phosphoribosylamino)uracil reductase RibD [Thermoanaerobaculia bacterium]|nr:bifunctional diaminohydroxyphosphoribosylaminopyrimidine deaminase/5-amino-6-(5-phosphoribosylamino)uracil reductase RibD [Thermoanaerobaculia bacterium]
MNDEQLMRHALVLAERGLYSVSPNPMVGCVVVRDGAIIAEGFHERAGEPHAEIAALRNADARGATVYVTLEPCSHQGRTGPCTEAIVEAGVTRAVVAMQDPNELVDGRGIAALRDAGIEVTTGVLEADARRLNEKFLWAMTHKLPFVLLKAGMTLDGKLATVTRESHWITSEAAREKSLALREEYDAILAGSGTIKADNPRLTRRLGLASGITPWTRVVLDGDGEVSPHAQILGDGSRTILFTSRPSNYAGTADLEIVPIEGRADLQSVFGALYERGIRSILVEGGALLHSEIIRRGLWQKMIVFIAPLVVGGAEAPAILHGEGVSRLTEGYRFRFDRAEFVGGDLMVVAYPS